MNFLHLLAEHPAERWIPGSFGLLITGIPLLFLIRELIRGYLAYGWKKVPGEIIESKSEVRWPSHRVKHVFARIRYRYQVEGESRIGDLVRFGHAIEAGEGAAKKLLREYPVGREVQVRVRGKQSVLLPGPSGWLFIWIPLVAFIFGGILYGLISGT